MIFYPKKLMKTTMKIKTKLYMFIFVGSFLLSCQMDSERQFYGTWEMYDLIYQDKNLLAQGEVVIQPSTVLTLFKNGEILLADVESQPKYGRYKIYNSGRKKYITVVIDEDYLNDTFEIKVDTANTNAFGTTLRLTARSQKTLLVAVRNVVNR